MRENAIYDEVYSSLGEFYSVLLAKRRANLIMLSNEDINNLQALYRSEFGVEISREDALEQGLKLVGLMSHVYQPMTQKEFDEIEERRRATAPEAIKNIRNNYEE